VTSTGQYVIAWDFGKVKKGQMDKYEIKKYEDLVVQDNFRFGDDKEIVRLYMTRETARSLIALVLDCRTAE
jgi:VID27 C-terminal WD40-like domain